jgi:maleate isomerase
MQFLATLPERRSPGARGRIGVIQPAPGVMIEHEWPRWIPDDVLFPVARVRLTGPTAQGYEAVAVAAPEAARDLVTAGAGVIAYACTIGSLFAGVAAEAELITAMTPYTPETNDLVERYIVDQGFAVAGFIPMPVSIVTVGELAPAEVAALAVEGMRGLPTADALWIPCTAIQTMAMIAITEGIVGRPVISGTQALLWHALDVLGVADPVRGAGRLFG